MYAPILRDTCSYRNPILHITRPPSFRQARSGYIRSGWKSIFSVLALAAKERKHGSALPRQAWEIARRLVDEDMDSLVYDFLDVTKVGVCGSVCVVDGVGGSVGVGDGNGVGDGDGVGDGGIVDGGVGSSDVWWCWCDGVVGVGIGSVWWYW